MDPAAWLIFPNQLFKRFTALPKDTLLCLVEEPLFFYDQLRSTTFSKIKLCYTRATMKRFEWLLKQEGFNHVVYLPFKKLSGSSLESLLLAHADTFNYYDSVDRLLQSRLGGMDKVQLLKHEDNPSFLFNEKDLAEYKAEVHGNPFFQTSFYRHFRHKTGFLMTKTGQYLGGKLSFDSDNRKKMAANVKLPSVFQEDKSNALEFWKEAKSYVETNFPGNPGNLDVVDQLISGKLPEFFAIDHATAEQHLDRFINERLAQFGPYQDAFLELSSTDLQKGALFHSCLSPYINGGLLDPGHVLERITELGDKAPIQSLEGFVRQVLGWREYIRFVYLEKGEEMRNANQLGNAKGLDVRWYNGSTGIPPVDDAIKFAFRNGYLHHILRLMVVANFMNISRIHPHEMYCWFMDFSLDSYDWVMIGNVYGMASFASPAMSTKPYISASNYALKMSDYQRGPWCMIWDGLFYRFLDSNKVLFMKNGRMGMMLANLMKKDQATKERLFADADKFLDAMPKYE